MQIVLVLLVAFVAGIEGILDEFEFHQPIVACTLIGLVTNHLAEGLLLGGSLQLIALGWANIGAAVAPDVCLASLIPTIVLLLIPSSMICSILEMIPVSIYKGLLIGSGVVCVVGFAIVANVLGSKFTYPFFMIGFGLACMTNLSLISLCFIGGGLVWLYMLLNAKEKSNKTSDDPLGDILNDYE